MSILPISGLSQVKKKKKIHTSYNMIRASPVVCEHYDVLQVENKDVMGQFIGVESLLLSTILHFELFIKVN